MASLLRRCVREFLGNGCSRIFIREVSKTPKGKKNLAVPRKKNVLGGKTKKTKGEKEPRDMSHDETKRIRALAMAYLDAPVPPSYRNLKDKKRELEREKLGLISKRRQRELDVEKMLKSKMEKEPSPEEEESEVQDGELIPPFDLTMEDGLRLAKSSSRVLIGETHARQKQWAAMLDEKRLAIKALPPHLREAAKVPDPSPFPAMLLRPSLVPPTEERKRKGSKKLLA